ncbi:hypothetical protein ACH5RR_006025 [Cinchona calisaya]|uniref:Ninja-family protein n=1 Tax=Cinchona calisaya TaxID=153742 RepID=A0ABD3AN50_9GENT
MEDDNGLDLSLALPCGGDSNTTKGKIGSSSDNRTEVSDRDTKLINEFKQFLDGSNMQISSGMVSQRIDSVKPENFFNNLSNTTVELDNSKNISTGVFWALNGRSIEGEENRTDIREKRKNVFGETSQQKKREKESDHSDLHDKARVSHISINTDDGSTAENEDVADSEAEASTSRQHLSEQDDVAKRYVGSGLSEVRKDFHGISESNVVELPGQKRFSISSEKEFKLGNMPHGVQFSAQPLNIMNMSQPLLAKDSNLNSVPSRPNYPLPTMMQVIAGTTSERTGSPSVMPGTVPLAVSYSSVQLPTLDKDNSRLMVSNQQIHPSFASRVLLNSDKHNDGLKITQVIPQKSSESKQHDGKALDHGMGNGKLLSEGGSSSHTEDDTKGSKASFSSKDGPELPRMEAFPSEYPTIKPGIAADLKFGGCGSYPNLPWVSTTAPGPNGRTISGVTYRYSPTQIRIVCACHGLHMSPEEFVRHAGEEPTNQDTSTGILPNSNPATSAQS